MVKIAHTADIHIRSLSRHDEYRHAFKAFVDDCETQGVDHIFVGGDIFHTKTTGISPEYIDLLTWWLREMSRVAPVHLILGNHDGNLVNASRQDAVSPIVDALGDPNVHLYKRSGVYPIAPCVNLCVFSLFDEEGWSRVAPVPGEINIACYHGPVWGSKTESDWPVEDGLRVDFFSEYDFTLLGDIHKRQDLAHRSKKPVMSYPGTLIQQNYAEELVHGYLLWNIESTKEWSVSFREIPNLRPYVTVPWTDDVQGTFIVAKKYPKGSRFRVKADVQISQDDMHRLSEAFKTRLSASEVTYKTDAVVDKSTAVVGASKVVKTDLRSVDTLVGLFKDHHGDEKLSEDDVASASLLIKSYLSAASNGEEVARDSKWSLNHLKWDNMFVYGEDNSIDFDKLNGIVGIFGPNRTGKSSVVGTLMYSLFNTTDRGPMKNIYVCNVRKNYCSSRAVLTHNGTSYVIERQTTKSTNKKGVVSASTALNLYRMREDGELDDLCGEQRNDTEKTIRGLIGSHEDFLMTSLSAQGEANPFISQGSTKRRSVLSRFLDLDIFDKMYDAANKDFNGLKSQLKNYPERDWDAVRADAEDQYRMLKERIDTNTALMTEAQTKLSLLRGELSGHNVKPVTQDDVDVQRQKITSLQKKSDECKASITSCEDEIVEFQKKIDAVSNVIKAIDVATLKKKSSAVKSLETSIVELKHAFDRENMLLVNQKKSLKILDEVPCGDDYPACKFIKDAHLIKSKVDLQTLKVKKSEEALKTAQDALDVLKDDSVDEMIEKHSRASDLLTKLELEVSKKETQIEKMRASCDSCTTSLEEAQTKLKHLEEALDSDESAEVVRIRSEIDTLNKSIRVWDAQKSDDLVARGSAKAKLEQLESEKSNRDDLLDKMRLQELISSAFSKKGIPMVIAKTQLPAINNEVAKILQGIVDFTIELESDEDSDALEIYINYGDSRRIVELCSGMEKTIASIALRVALANVSSLPKPDIFIIDEGFGTLDAPGVESCNRLLGSLKSYFRTIVVITHVDGIKDAADHVIEITRREKDSHMEHS
jgi:Calcineurin-like phosphoesterase